METSLIKGLALDKDIARISLISINKQKDKLFNIFSVLAKENIGVDMIIQSIQETKKDISFTVSKADFNKVIDLIEENRDSIDYTYLVKDENVAKISVVGDAISTNTKVMANIFEVLVDLGINILMTSTCQIRISIIVDESHVELVTNRLHDKLFKQELLLN